MERPSAVVLVAALRLRDPVDGFQQARRPQCTQHRVDGVVAKQLLGSRTQPVGIALIVLLPILQHLVDRDPLTCPIDDLVNTKVFKTWLGGKVVYEGK